MHKLDLLANVCSFLLYIKHCFLDYLVGEVPERARLRPQRPTTRPPPTTTRKPGGKEILHYLLDSFPVFKGTTLYILLYYSFLHLQSGQTRTQILNIASMFDIFVRMFAYLATLFTRRF